MGADLSEAVPGGSNIVGRDRCACRHGPPRCRPDAPVNDGQIVKDGLMSDLVTDGQTLEEALLAWDAAG